MKRSVLVVDSGGRGVALAWKLERDGCEVFRLPGNMDIKDILRFAREKNVLLTVPGSEDLLAKGIVDTFHEAGKLIFGPTFKAARLETSKLYARLFMRKNHIPQPEFIVTTNQTAARVAKKRLGLPVVVKADGLAAGKGAIVCRSEEEFEEALKIMFIERRFGSACDLVLIERCVEGEELSVFFDCDGFSYKILGTAQDYKRIGDNDTGENTGGMGAYSPTPLSTPGLMKKVEEKILIPTLMCLQKRGMPYTGVLYVSLMISGDDIYVIEFNARFGDPETQVVLPLLESSLFDLLYNTALGWLDRTEVEMKPGYATTVVLASGGYPGPYEKDKEIFGLENLGPDEIMFHAGTREENGRHFTAGGRVLNPVGVAGTLGESIRKAYVTAGKISFAGMHYRKDIGQRGLRYIAQGVNKTLRK